MARPPEKPLKNFDEVLERLFQATQSRNARQFSKAIGLDSSAVSRTLKARRIPQGWFDAVCNGFNTTERCLRYGDYVVSSEEPTKKPEVIMYRDRYYAGLEREMKLLREKILGLEAELAGTKKEQSKQLG